MLVLSRKVGEKIRIGDNITIVVTQIRLDRVRIGVEAPDGVQVDREEVRKDKEQDHERSGSRSSNP